MNSHSRAADDDDDDDWDDGDEAADFGDYPGDDPTVPCPYCRREILEDSPQCPYCERSISAEDHAGPKKPLWLIATALLCLGIAFWCVFAVF